MKKSTSYIVASQRLLIQRELSSFDESQPLGLSSSLPTTTEEYVQRCKKDRHIENIKREIIIEMEAFIEDRINKKQKIMRRKQPIHVAEEEIKVVDDLKLEELMNGKKSVQKPYTFLETGFISDIIDVVYKTDRNLFNGNHYHDKMKLIVYIFEFSSGKKKKYFFKYISKNYKELILKDDSQGKKKRESVMVDKSNVEKESMISIGEKFVPQKDLMRNQDLHKSKKHSMSLHTQNNDANFHFDDHLNPSSEYHHAHPMNASDGTFFSSINQNMEAFDDHDDQLLSSQSHLSSSLPTLIIPTFSCPPPLLSSSSSNELSPFSTPREGIQISGNYSGSDNNSPMPSPKTTTMLPSNHQNMIPTSQSLKSQSVMMSSNNMQSSRSTNYTSSNMNILSSSYRSAPYMHMLNNHLNDSTSMSSSLSPDSPTSLPNSVPANCFIMDQIDASSKKNKYRLSLTLLPEFKWEVHTSDIIYHEQKKIIGRGSYGNVYQGRYKNKKVAVKRLPKGNDQVLVKEISILCQLYHPNIVKFIGAILGNHPSIVMKYESRGNLGKLLKKHASNPFPLKRLHSMAYDIALGVEYLHSRNIIHGDIKPSNVLVSKTYQCKLSDFGISLKGNNQQNKSHHDHLPTSLSSNPYGIHSSFLDDDMFLSNSQFVTDIDDLSIHHKLISRSDTDINNDHTNNCMSKDNGRMRSNTTLGFEHHSSFSTSGTDQPPSPIGIGSEMYLAPELFEGIYSQPTMASDIYSLGLTLYALYSYESPFANHWDWIRAMSLNERPHLPDSWPHDISTLIRRCWQYDEKERPSAKEVVSVLGKILAE